MNDQTNPEEAAKLKADAKAKAAKIKAAEDAEAAKAKAAKAKAAEDAEAAKPKITVICSVAGGRRRAGISWAGGTTEIDPADLSEEQRKALDGDPMFTVIGG